MDTKRSVFSNMIWRFAERFGAQGVTFIVSLVIARLLDPAVYGTVALITVFTTILQVFVDSGLGTALIQKKNADDLDFSSVFFFNMASCLCLYGVMFLAAEPIARFYEMPELVPMVRVMSLTLVISGVKNIQQAYVSRNMLFKRFFFATLGGTIGAAVLGVWMAYRGYGVWALIAQNLFNQTVDTAILWLTVRWRPRAMFSWQRLKGLFSYGWKLLASSLLDTAYGQLRQLIIGKLYTTGDLAFYNKGDNFPAIVATNINTSIDSVLLPTMSSAQEDVERVRIMTRRAMRTSVYIMAPMMVGLACVARPLVALLLTEKWLPCVPFMQIFCVGYIFHPIHTSNLNAIKALGRSDLFLRLEIVKKVMGLTLLLGSMWFGPLAMAYSTLLGNLAGQIVNSWPNKKLLGYGYGQQLKDIVPSLLLSAAMGACVLAVSQLGLSDLLTLIVQVTVGVAVYWLGSKLAKFETYEFILGVLKGYLHRGKEEEK